MNQGGGGGGKPNCFHFENKFHLNRGDELELHGRDGKPSRLRGSWDLAFCSPLAWIVPLAAVNMGRISFLNSSRMVSSLAYLL